ncbi:MAG TPA: hypothetical protein VGC56_09345 [Allosphingosinicella sp.]
MSASRELDLCACQKERTFRTMRASTILLAGTIAAASCTEQPKRETWALVVSIAPHANPKWHPDEVVVTARSETGAVGTKTVEMNRLTCRVGDTVHASSRGIALTLDEQACVR